MGRGGLGCGAVISLHSVTLCRQNMPGYLYDIWQRELCEAIEVRAILVYSVEVCRGVPIVEGVDVMCTYPELYQSQCVSDILRQDDTDKNRAHHEEIWGLNERLSSRGYVVGVF